tara:strand:+ start:496 stop:606 length:111 start_codon:yes stop_codon:yes gene_type:complete
VIRALLLAPVALIAAPAAAGDDPDGVAVLLGLRFWF